VIKIVKMHRMLYRYHSVFGHSYVPNQKVRIPNAEGAYIIKTNGQSFRSDSDYVIKKSESKRFIFLGDSHTAGDGSVSNDDRFTNIIQNSSSDVECYNFACGGYGIDQQVLVYEYLAKKYEHDLVCFSFHVKDDIGRFNPKIDTFSRLSNQILSISKPYYSLEEKQFSNIPVPHSVIKSLEGKKSQEPNTVSSISKIKQFIRSIAYDDENPKYIRDYCSYLLKFYSRMKLESPRSHEYRAIRDLIHRLIILCEDKPLILSPLVDPRSLYSNPDYRKLYRHFTSNFSNVYYIDLVKDLKSRSRNYRWNLLNKFTFHYNLEGQKYVSNLILDKLKKERLL
tara:strand:- start:2733 stop:3746 length:1014 start_codon:yes stop_codon:yes gene_type:complete